MWKTLAILENKYGEDKSEDEDVDFTSVSQHDQMNNDDGHEESSTNNFVMPVMMVDTSII